MEPSRKRARVGGGEAADHADEPLAFFALGEEGDDDVLSEEEEEEEEGAEGVCATCC
jgi:hypothetical protein